MPPPNELNLDEAEFGRLEEDMLFQELGIALSRHAAAIAAESGLLSPDELLGGSGKERRSFKFLRDLGERFFNNLSVQFYNLICNADDPDNAKVIKWIKTGTDVAAGSLAVFLGGYLGVAMVIAKPLANLIIRKVVKAGADAVCETWRERLPDAAKAKLAKKVEKKDDKSKDGGK